MSVEFSALATDELICLLLVGAGGRLDIDDLRVFLGPRASGTVDSLLDDGWLTSDTSHGGRRLATAAATPTVVGVLHERGDEAGQAGDAALADLRSWMAEQFRVDVVVHLIPWLPADEEAVGYLLDHGRVACRTEPAAVLTALGHVARYHREPLCPALRSVLALALDAVGRREEAITCATRALDMREPEPACGHQFGPADTAGLALWLAQRRATRVEEAMDGAEQLRLEAPGSQASSPLRPEREADLLIELFFAQCWSTELSGARRSLDTLWELAELVDTPRMTGVIRALRAYYSCLAGDLVGARREARAALEYRPVDPRSAHVAHTVLAWAALSDVDPTVDAHVRVAETQAVQPPTVAGFLSTARALDLAQTHGSAVARDTIRADVELSPPRTPTARLLRLTSLADLAWTAGDTRELRSVQRELSDFASSGEAAMVTARLHVGRRDGDDVLRRAVRSARQSVLPFTPLRVTHATAEHLWVTGRRGEADRMLARAIETGERRHAVRFTRDMFLHRPDWAEHVREALASGGTPSPRWLPTGTVGHAEAPTALTPIGPARSDRRDGPLSPAEMRVLDAMAAGLTAMQTADRLYLSPHTVRTHHKAIYRKLGVHHRADAIAVGRARGWF